MTLEQYLQRHPHQILTLVGPLLKKPQSFTRDPVVFIDGGTQFRTESFGFSVGDGDSFNKPLDETLPANKDFSDLAYVLKHVDQYRKIDAFGFWGERKDHELANLGEFQQFLKRQKRAEVHLPPFAKGYSAGSWSLLLNGLFSLLVLENAEIQMSGDLQYPILEKKQVTTLSSLGISNEAHGSIQIESSMPFFLFHQF